MENLFAHPVSIVIILGTIYVMYSNLYCMFEIIIVLPDMIIALIRKNNTKKYLVKVKYNHNDSPKFFRSVPGLIWNLRLLGSIWFRGLAGFRNHLGGINKK